MIFNMKIPVIKVKDMETGMVHIVGTDPADNLQIDTNGNIFYHKNDTGVKCELLSVEFKEPAEYLNLMMIEMMELPAETSFESMKECVATGIFTAVQTIFEMFEKHIGKTMDIITRDKTFHLTPYNYLHIGNHDRSYWNPELVNSDERYSVTIVREIRDGRAHGEEIIRLKDEEMAEQLSCSIEQAIEKNLHIFDVEEWISKYDSEKVDFGNKISKVFYC